MTGILEQLFHYPIKGLSGQGLARVDLRPGQGFPHDRIFGFARPNSGFDPKNPAPLPKTKFVVLARDAALAQLDTRFDPETGVLLITRGDSPTAFDITTAKGRKDAAACIADHLGMAPEDAPTLYGAHPHRFTDVSVVSPQMMNAVSLINRDSVAGFAQMIGQDISPARFRSNIVFSGIDPFTELDWIDRDIALGDARLRLVKRTKRCAATEVNLQTGTRDLKLPQLLHQHLGHFDMGIYAEVIEGGSIAPGDTLKLLD